MRVIAHSCAIRRHQLPRACWHQRRRHKRKAKQLHLVAVVNASIQTGPVGHVLDKPLRIDHAVVMQVQHCALGHALQQLEQLGRRHLVAAVEVVVVMVVDEVGVNEQAQ